MNKEAHFSKIYKDSIKPVYRYIFGLVGNKERTEDICSQATLIALKKFNETEEPITNPKNWFIGIARNCLLNEFKKKSLNVSMPENLEIPADGIEISELLIIEEDAEKIKAIFKQLDSDSKEILILRIWEEFKFNEISRITGKNESTVKSLYYRAVEEIRIKYFQDEKKNQKKYMFIIGGLSSIGKQSEFAAPSEFINSSLHKFSNTHSMEPIKEGAAMSSSAPSAVVGSKTTLLLIGSIAVLMVGVIGSYIYFKPENLTTTLTTSESCDYLGVEYEEGESYKLDCNTCTCVNGNFSCTEIACEEGTDSDTTDAEETTDPYTGWETYHNVEFDVAFMYPADWTIEEVINGSGDTRGLAVKVKKDSYNIKISIPAGSDPSLCRYPDTPPSEPTIPDFGIDFKEYVEKTKGELTIRRPKTHADSETGLLHVCKQDLYTGNFVTWMQRGFIIYETPNTADQEYMEIMDMITITYNNL